MGDLRSAIRGLLNAPAFAAAAVLTLGLGIGATTLIYSITDHVVIRPLAYPAADRLVLVREVIHELEGTFPSVAANAGHFLEWRRRCTGCETMAAIFPVDRILSGAGDPVRLSGARVSAELFPLIGASAAAGRLFTPNDDRAGAAPVVVLSYPFWRERFGGDPSVVGRSIMLDGGPTEVVGVLAPGIRLPKGQELGSPRALAADPAFYAPLALTTAESLSPGAFDYAVIARLRPGHSVPAVQAELDRIDQQYTERRSDRIHVRSLVLPLQSQVVGGTRSTLLLLLATVTAVLLIVWVNVANLMLARNVARRRESAVRLSLGAGRGRLVRQALVESLVLALAGGLLGVAIAAAGLGSVLRLAPPDLPRAAEIALDGRVLAVSLTLTLGAGLLFGTIPARRFSAVDPATVLRDDSRSQTASRAVRATRNLLVAAQVGLCAFLLVATGLLGSSFVRVLGVDKGFDSTRVLAMDLDLPLDPYARPDARAQWYEAALTQVRAVAGVERAAITSSIPLEGERQVDLLALEHDARPELERPAASITAVSTDYFATLGIPLRRGRPFELADRARPVVILSERAARALWPDRDPIGRRVIPGSNLPVAEVIGVVGDVRSSSLEREGVLVAYVPLAGSAPADVALLVRTAGRPSAVAGEVARAVRTVGPLVALAGTRTLDQVVAAALARRRFQILVLAMFAGAALATASVGIAGIISHGLRERRGEIAVRLALGARPADVIRLVWREEMRPVATGLVLGLAASLIAGFLFRDLLFEVRPFDPLVLAAATGTLALVAALACWIPTRSATSRGPTGALRLQ